MDFKGYEKAMAAFEDASITADIVPIPTEGENLPFVTVETHSDVPPASVLNALTAHGLMKPEHSRAIMRSIDPELEVVGIQPGSITMYDRKSHYRQIP